MESLPRLIVPGSPQPGFSPQPLILDPRQGMAGAAQGAQPLVLSRNQLEVEAQRRRWFLSQLPYPMVRVQPLERDIGPQAPVPAWGEPPVRDWRSELYASPANPDAAITDAVGRRSGNRRVRRNGRLYTGDAAAARLNQGALAEPTPVARSIAILAGGGATAADPWTLPFQPRQQQAAPPPLAAPQLLLPPGRTAAAAPQTFAPQPVVALSGIRRPATDHALGTQAANGPKIEAAIAGTQTQPMAVGSGGAVLDPTAADPTASRQPAPGGAVLDTLLDAASAVADPVLTNASGGGPGTSTAKGNQLIDAKLNERINAFLGRGTPAAAGRAQLPLTTGFRAGGDGGGGGGGGLRQAGQRLRTAVTDATTPAFGEVDLGVGKLLGNHLDDLAKSELLANAPQAANAMKGLARGARVLAPAAALAAPLIPVAMGAAEGYQDAGAGGALIQGGSAALGGVAGGALAGALAGSVVPGFGNVIGGILGGLGGMALGKGVTGLAKGAVDAAQGGDTGLMGQIGRTLDPIIDTNSERQQREIMREMNSPAMKAVRLQQEQREAKARADQARAALLQSYLS